MSDPVAIQHILGGLRIGRKGLKPAARHCVSVH
jgi:hypothetical protein